MINSKDASSFMAKMSTYCANVTGSDSYPEWQLEALFMHMVVLN